MEQRRFFLFFVISMGIWLAWINYAVPMFFPGLLKQPKSDSKKITETLTTDAEDRPADALHPVNEYERPAAVAQAEKTPEFPKFPERAIEIGTPDLDTPDTPPKRVDDFLIAAGLSSNGAAIDYVELTDKKRYPAFGHRGLRARVLGANPKTLLRTFSMQAPVIDKQLGGLSLDLISWELVPEKDLQESARAATFRFVSPDKQWEITKRFEIHQLTDAEQAEKHVRDTLVDAYEVKLKVTVRNLTDKSHPFTYTLQGPVGVPLEDAENSYKYRDVRVGFLRDDGSNVVDESKVAASDIVKKAKTDANQVWKRKLKYIGVDVLYFAALILPQPDQVESSKATVVSENSTKPEYSDVTVELTSNSVQVPASGEFTHEYTMFAGPKRKELIGPLSAMAVMDYGWFDSICRGMVWLLNTFHSMGLSYGLAIICLTVCVRTLLLPISKHQAANASRMKELQPKLLAKQKELEAKYGKNTEEYMRAAQEMSKEQLGMMMSGCLPVFLQLPIFIALYRAIGSSIDLRMEPFLWFENLASPDALFAFPFRLRIPIPPFYPWPDWSHFNLLPCISTALMYFHQKMTAPPPTNEEQAQQQKMMNFMMIFMGVMFFRVPSGLCLYFIATNIWSMTERWLFEHLKKKSPPASETTLAFSGGGSSSTGGTTILTKSGAPSTPAEPAKPSALNQFWNRLQDAADNQRTASKQLGNSNRDNNKKKKKR